MIHLEPLGTGILLPAFLVGYELTTDMNDLDQWEGLSPWVVVVDQQAGGLAMSYPSVVGAVLRLEANADKAKKDPTRLVRGFRLMAEDPDLETLRQEYRVLSGLVLTHGQAYSSRQLRDLENVLSAFFWIPPLKCGIEAFVRHEACDPLDSFGGWRVLRCSVRQDGSLSGSAYTLPGYYIEQGNMGDLELTDDVAYDETRQRELMTLGAKLGKAGLPDVFLLWENSD